MSEATEFAELVTSLAQTPAALAKLIANLSSQEVTHKASPDEFSAVENICHLRDIEIEGYSFRISRILKEDHPFLPDIDGTRLAIERDYNRQSLQEALADIHVSETAQCDDFGRCQR